MQQRQTYRAKKENQCLQETMLSINASVMGEKPKNWHQPAAGSSLNTGQWRGAAGVMSGAGDSISSDQSCRYREVLCAWKKRTEWQRQPQALPLLADWPTPNRMKIYLHVFLQDWTKSAEYAAALPLLKPNLSSLSDELGSFSTKTVQTLSYNSLTTQWLH